MHLTENNMFADIYIVDLLFRAKKIIRSLPVYHGARWTALLRLACKNMQLSMEDLILGVLPFRQGKRFIQQNELLKVRIFFNSLGFQQYQTIVDGICNTPVEGLFSASSLQLENVIEVHAPFSLQCVEKEVLILQRLTHWHLVFYVPLRLTLPAGYKRGTQDKDRYCQADFFNLGQIAIELLLKHIRWQNYSLNCDILFDIVRNDLQWVNMRYGQERHIVLGGLVGQLFCSGRLCTETAQRLVLGTYLGAGKNARFGLGWWSIPELGSFSSRYHFFPS